jgi:hypothetical protein
VTARAALLALAAAGCSVVPDVGPRLAGTCDDTDSRSAGKPVSFAGDLQPLILRNMGGCSCHLNGIGTQLAGLNLSSVSTLRRGGFNSGSRIVVPGDPCNSILYQKVSDGPPFGSRMPLNGPPFWTADEIQLLHDWIAEGANDN